jgi:hypothetical protein
MANQHFTCRHALIYCDTGTACACRRLLNSQLHTGTHVSNNKHWSRDPRIKSRKLKNV